MDGSRRLLVGSIVLAVAACQPTPQVTHAPPGPTSSPTASATPASSTGPSSTPATSAPPTSVDLPPGFDAIPWAHLSPLTGDEGSFTLSIGVIGKQATITRTVSREPSVWASGGAVVVDSGVQVDIVNPATGSTIATFDREALRLSLDGVDPEEYSYRFAPQRFIVDVAHGYLYDLGANPDGIQLRRFDLDGSHEALLGVLAPDPARDPWDSVDVVVSEEGAIVATSCPAPASNVADHRCRLYQAAPGAKGPIKPRYLPRTSPRPCSLFAASADYLIATQYVGCRADGGPPLVLPYMALNLSTLKSLELDAASDIRVFGMLDAKDGPGLVANLESSYPFPSPYPAVGVVMRFDNSAWALEPWIEIDDDSEASADPYAGYVWAIRGRGPAWTLMHGYGPEYAVCALTTRNEPPSACPSGPEMLSTPSGRFELPAGTWGEIVPPLEFPAL